MLPKILVIHRETSTPAPLINAIHAFTSDSLNLTSLVW